MSDSINKTWSNWVLRRSNAELKARQVKRAAKEVAEPFIKAETNAMYKLSLLRWQENNRKMLGMDISELNKNIKTAESEAEAASRAAGPAKEAAGATKAAFDALKKDAERAAKDFKPTEEQLRGHNLFGAVAEGIKLKGKEANAVYAAAAAAAAARANAAAASGAANAARANAAAVTQGAAATPPHGNPGNLVSTSAHPAVADAAVAATGALAALTDAHNEISSFNGKNTLPVRVKKLRKGASILRGELKKLEGSTRKLRNLVEGVRGHENGAAPAAYGSSLLNLGREEIALLGEDAGGAGAAAAHEPHGRARNLPPNRPSAGGGSRKHRRRRILRKSRKIRRSRKHR